MSITEIRKKLHNYIDIADDSKVASIFNLVESEINYNSISKESLIEIKKRSDQYKKGESKVFSSKEVLSILKKQHRNAKVV